LSIAINETMQSLPGQDLNEIDYTYVVRIGLYYGNMKICRHMLHWHSFHIVYMLD